jgi:hypothetical protein
MRLSRPPKPSLRATCATSVAALVGLCLVVLSPAPAQAHKHPTPVELISPAVVRIQTYGEVSISLIENTVTGRYSSDTKLVQRTFKPMLSSGSGFVVDPAGAIVTSPAVTGVDLNRAVVFAVNKMFNERYGAGAPMPDDPYTKVAAAGSSGDDVEQRRQRCYTPNTTDETGGCVVFVTRKVVVLPFVSNQGSFGNLNADVIYPTEGKKADVAILKVGANSMPAVNLGETITETSAVSTLGFATTPSNEKSLRVIQGHMPKKGDPTLKNDEYIAQVRSGLRDGLAGGPIVNEKGQVVGFLVNDPKTVKITTAEQVQSALAQADIKPKRGPTDAVYENALHNFNNQYYTAAASNLAQVLKLYPGDALAAEKLAIANQRKGTSADKGAGGTSGNDTFGFDDAASSGKQDSSPNLLLWGGGAAVAVLVVLLVVMLVRGRRKQDDDEEPDEMQGAGQPGYGYYQPGGFAVPGVPGAQPGQQYPPLGSPYPGGPAVPAGYGPGGPVTGWEQQTMRYLSPEPGQPSAPPSGQYSGPQTNPQDDDQARLGVIGTPGTDAGANSQTVLTRPDARTGVPAMQCAQCDQPVQAGQQFCGFCGTRAR